jgi:hypothetical protein
MHMTAEYPYHNQQENPNTMGLINMHESTTSIDQRMHPYSPPLAACTLGNLTSPWHLLQMAGPGMGKVTVWTRANHLAAAAAAAACGGTRRLTMGKEG